MIQNRGFSLQPHCYLVGDERHREEKDDDQTSKIKNREWKGKTVEKAGMSDVGLVAKGASMQK
jgi:hypothetical protein